ncbi:hypothetical protein AAHE18_19G073500 [Arachis hypogaea]
MHVGAVKHGDKAIVIDDLVATGGTLSAAITLLMCYRKVLESTASTTAKQHLLSSFLKKMLGMHQYYSEALYVCQLALLIYLTVMFSEMKIGSDSFSPRIEMFSLHIFTC